MEDLHRALLGLFIDLVSTSSTLSLLPTQKKKKKRFRFTTILITNFDPRTETAHKKAGCSKEE